MSIIDAIIFGIVEGITEFLPISSTGHLILVAKILGLPETDFLKSFQISIQLGAILSVVVLYFRQLFLEWEIMKRIMVALVPAIGIGGVFYASIRQLFASELTVVLALGIGGIIIILFEIWHKEREQDAEDLAILPYRTVFLIGLFQALAVVPGVSRAAATILGGRFLGLKRVAIVEFSFLLAVPTMVAATTLDLMKSVALFSTADFSLLSVGFIMAFITSIIAIRGLLRFVQTHTFIGFGIYRIIIALLFFVLVLS
ncbi:MAG: undecaprenyl-diphosphatase UppP [Minisyncoccota bacterium]